MLKIFKLDFLNHYRLFYVVILSLSRFVRANNHEGRERERGQLTHCDMVFAAQRLFGPNFGNSPLPDSHGLFKKWPLHGLDMDIFTRGHFFQRSKSVCLQVFFFSWRDHVTWVSKNPALGWRFHFVQQEGEMTACISNNWRQLYHSWMTYLTTFSLDLKLKKQSLGTVLAYTSPLLFSPYDWAVSLSEYIWRCTQSSRQ